MERPVGGAIVDKKELETDPHPTECRTQLLVEFFQRPFLVVQRDDHTDVGPASLLLALLLSLLLALLLTLLLLGLPARLSAALRAWLSLNSVLLGLRGLLRSLLWGLPGGGIHDAAVYVKGKG
jgi:hypothetical protein